MMSHFFTASPVEFSEAQTNHEFVSSVHGKSTIEFRVYIDNDNDEFRTRAKAIIAEAFESSRKAIEEVYKKHFEK